MANSNDGGKLDAIVARAHRERQSREQGYRAKALKMYPWICGRCMREFSNANLQELTVHHRNHDHDYNPQDGTNWELLCLYCHDNEHSRYIDGGGDLDTKSDDSGPSNNPFADLKSMLGKKSN